VVEELDVAKRRAPLSNLKGTREKEREWCSREKRLKGDEGGTMLAGCNWEELHAEGRETARGASQRGMKRERNCSGGTHLEGKTPTLRARGPTISEVRRRI